MIYLVADSLRNFEAGFPSFFVLLYIESTGDVDPQFEVVSFGRVSISKQP
jgi:hypothetical protein